MRTDGSRRLGGQLILVVEDDFLVARDLVEALENHGATTVGPFPTTSAAIHALRNNGAIDAAVLDINLNGSMVYPVSDVLRKKNIPFLFATGYDANAIPEQYRNVPRCEKPVEVEMLVRMLEKQLHTSTASGGRER